MLFNGKYYNKPGHLGMTRAELKEALAGGGGGGLLIPVVYNIDRWISENEITIADINAAYAAGKPVFIYAKDSNEEGRGYLYTPVEVSNSEIIAVNFGIDPDVLYVSWLTFVTSGTKIVSTSAQDSEIAYTGNE